MSNNKLECCPFCIHNAVIDYADETSLIELCERLKKELDKYKNMWDYYKRMLYHEYRSGKIKSPADKSLITLVGVAEEFYLGKETTNWGHEDDRRSSKEHKRNE